MRLGILSIQMEECSKDRCGSFGRRIRLEDTGIDREYWKQACMTDWY